MAELVEPILYSGARVLVSLALYETLLVSKDIGIMKEKRVTFLDRLLWKEYMLGHEARSGGLLVVKFGPLKLQHPSQTPC